MIANIRLRPWLVVPLLIAAASGLWLANDGRHHWDEPGYLYAGLYQSTGQIIDGDVQPSGIPHFTQGRILHALSVKSVMHVAGSGTNGFRLLVAINLTLVLIALAMIFRILRELLPDVSERRVAGVLIAMSPVVLYLALKVLADNEGLVAALAATWAMLRFGRGGSLALAVPATLGLAVAALSKNQMVFMPAALWAALCLVPIADIDRKRFALFGIACGVAGFVVTVAILEGLGIGLQSYVASYGELTEDRVPLVAKFVNVGNELGILWLLLPFALLSARRRELRALGLWFLFAMAPFVLLINSIEARHIAVNLVAVGGLFALALEAIRLRSKAWARLSDRSRSFIAVLAVAVIMASNAVMLAIMPHRVDLDELHALLVELDGRYGPGRYALLTATGYTDFQILRVLWPEVDARDVGTDAIAVREGKNSRRDVLDTYLGDRHHESIEELRALDRPLIYLGYRQTFAAENLRRMIACVSPPLAEKLLGNVNLIDRLHSPETRWLWDNPDLKLEPLAAVGRYLAFEVQLDPESGPEPLTHVR
jgi:hypothetical protein